MSAVTTFSFEGLGVRIVDREGAPWWVLSDACKVLEIGNSRDAAARLDDDEKGVATIDTLGGPQQVTIINEGGLYCLILSSRKPQAKRFKKWVTGEVLPQIRRTGSYGQTALPNFADPVAAARAWADEREQVILLQAKTGSRPDKSSAVAFAARKGFQFPNPKLTTLSKRARKMASKHGRCPERVHDERWPNGILIHDVRDLEEAWGDLGWPDVPALPVDARVQ